MLSLKNKKLELGAEWRRKSTRHYWLGGNKEYDTEDQHEDEANSEEQQHGTETPSIGTNFRNESHIPALEIPVEGRAKRHMREPIWMTNYKEGESLSDDDNTNAMLVTEDDQVTFEDAVKRKKVTLNFMLLFNDQINLLTLDIIILYQ